MNHFRTFKVQELLQESCRLMFVLMESDCTDDQCESVCVWEGLATVPF